MATLTLTNVPDDLHRRLQERAERNRRSLDREAVLLLEQAVGAPVPPPVDEALARADALRKRLAARGFRTTAEEVQAAIDEGRP